MQRNVNDWERAVSVAAGVALLALAARKRVRPAVGATGVGLIARGALGFCPVNRAMGRARRRDDTRVALGGERGVRVKERIVIARSAEELFAFWRNLARLPLFLRHIERVDVLDDKRSHWVARGPGNLRLEWDAEIINEIEPELIAWRSLPGADVASAGSVHFRPISHHQTELLVTLQYDPPGGKVGASLAWLAGQSGAAELREDLRHLKRSMELREIPA